MPNKNLKLKNYPSDDEEFNQWFRETQPQWAAEIDAQGIEFKCPRCGGHAFAYKRTDVGCINCGKRLYTEIPTDVKIALKSRT